jgi:hypothetical protein
VKVDEDRLNELEVQVKELTKQVSRLSEIISDRICPKDYELVNPWSLAALDLGSALPQYNALRFGIYQPTIEALKSTDDGYTAEEISKITGRSRNTESGYMYRLFRAGILKRVRKGKRVNYVLTDKDLADKIFRTQ